MKLANIMVPALLLLIVAGCRAPTPCKSGAYTADGQCCTCNTACPNGYEQGTCNCKCAEDSNIDELFEDSGGIAPQVMPSP